jgi:hypothetical protein
MAIQGCLPAGERYLPRFNVIRRQTTLNRAGTRLSTAIQGLFAAPQRYPPRFKVVSPWIKMFCRG